MNGGNKLKKYSLTKLADQVTGELNRPYARQLLHMRMNEWVFRYHIMLAYRQLGPQSPILTALSKTMGEHHNENLIQLEQLIDKYGWPKLSTVGEEAAYAAGNVVNHSDLAIRQRYLPLLEETCEAGEADWSRYAHILDRTELELGNPQVYGTQMEMNEATGMFEPRPIVDADAGRCTSRRKRHGAS